MNHVERGLFVAILVVFFPAFGFYHLMIFKVNRHLPLSGKMPHQLRWEHWKRLAWEYRNLYPRSILYTLTLSLTVALLLLAIGLVAERILG